MKYDMVIASNTIIHGEDYVYFFYKNKHIGGRWLKTYKGLNNEERIKLHNDLSNKVKEIDAQQVSSGV